MHDANGVCTKVMVLLTLINKEEEEEEFVNHDYIELAMHPIFTLLCIPFTFHSALFRRPIKIDHKSINRFDENEYDTRQVSILSVSADACLSQISKYRMQ